MQKLPSDSLYQLIQSLTKEEKRYFKLFAKNMGGQQSTYLQVFDLLEKQKEYNENTLRPKLQTLGISTQAFSAHKKHLYPLIIKSLELLHQDDSIEEEILSALKHIRILYRKGLLQQAYLMTTKLEKTCLDYDKIFYLPKVQEWRILLENMEYRYKSWSAADFDDYCQQMLRAADNIRRYVQYRHLTGNSYIMFGLQQTGGYARSESFRQWLQQREAVPPQNDDSINVWLAYLGAQILRHEALRQGKEAIVVARQIIERLNAQPLLLLDSSMRTQYGDAALRGMDWSVVQHSPPDFDFFRHAFEQMDKTSMPLYFQTKFLHKQLLHYTEMGNTDLLLQTVTQLQSALDEDRQKPHLPEVLRIAVYFSLGTALFSSAQFDDCLVYFQFVVDNASTVLPTLYSSARLLLLLVYFEKGEFLLLPYSVRALYRALLKDQTLFAFERIVLRRLNNLSQAADKKEKMSILSDLYAEMLPLQNSEIDSEPLLYFNYLAWAKSKMQEIPLAEFLHANY